MRSDYKLYKNYGMPGDRIFVTTTVLDFVPVFKDSQLAEVLAEELFKAHQETGAKLHAFVVMSHHVHFVTTLSGTLGASEFVRRFKSKSAIRMKPLIPEDLVKEFDMQRGLNKRQFWKVSFRSYTIQSNEDFFQKVRYVHLNPVRAGTCEFPHDYRWSSACLIQAERWVYDEGIRYEDSLDLSPAVSNVYPQQQAVEG